MKKEKKELKMSLWTFYVLVIGLVILISAIAMIGIYYYKSHNEIGSRISQTDKNISDNQGNFELRISGIKEKWERLSEAMKEYEFDEDKSKEILQEFRNEESFVPLYNYDDIIAYQAKSESKISNILNEDNTKLLKENKGVYELRDNNYQYTYKPIESSFDSYYIERNSNNKTEAYIACLFDIKENSNLNIKGYTPYKVNAINGEIKKVFVAIIGQDTRRLATDVFVLMEDGTLKYVNCLEGMLTGTFNAYECKGIGKIDDIIQTNVKRGKNKTSGEPEWFDIVLKKADGKYYSWSYNIEGV